RTEQQEQVSQPKPQKKIKKNIFNRLFLDILGGDFLAQDWARRQANYILFLAAIALVYIANSFYTEGIARKIDTISRDLKELQFEYISSKSKLMHESKQSELTRKLKQTGLKESVEPVKKIVTNKNNKK
ncbi:MAG: FtsL-like putative cell division protein, partial [Bacteroidales bacterium]|nr:FtsL-like putative cell division protein [Bacteroidales bacterium]